MIIRLQSKAIMVISLVFSVSQATHADDFEARLAKLKKDGKPTTLTELWPRGISEKDNGAVLLAKQSQHLRAFELAIFDFDEGMMQRRVDDAVMEFHRKLIARHPDLLDAIRDSANAKKFVPYLDFAKSKPQDAINDVQKSNGRLRSAARVLMFHARVLAAKGEGDHAAEAALLMIRVARHAQDQPFLISNMTGCACHRMAIGTLGHVLQKGGVSDNKRKEIDADLARYETANLVRTLETERAFGLVQSKIMSDRTRLAYLDYCQFQISNASLTFPEYQAKLKEMDADVRKEMLRQPLVSMIEPSNAMVRKSNTSVLGLARCVRVLNRLQQKKWERAEGAEKKLGLSKVVLSDPFTDEPIEIKMLDSGWLVSFSGGAINPIGKKDQEDKRP